MATGCFSFAFRRIPSFLLPADHASKLDEENAGPDSDVRSKSSGLFRSKSEMNVKKFRKSGFLSKPSLSEGDVRKMALSGQKYRRVLRDLGSSPSTEDQHDENPHVVHKFTKEFLGKHNIDKGSEHYSDGAKKPASGGGSTGGGDRPRTPKRNPKLSKPTISFENEVEVIEYDKQEDVETKPLYTHREKLTTGDEMVKVEEEEEEVDNEPPAFQFPISF